MALGLGALLEGASTALLGSGGFQRHLCVWEPWWVREKGGGGRRHRVRCPTCRHCGGLPAASCPPHDAITAPRNAQCRQGAHSAPAGSGAPALHVCPLPREDSQDTLLCRAGLVLEGEGSSGGGVNRRQSGWFPLNFILLNCRPRFLPCTD